MLFHLRKSEMIVIVFFFVKKHQNQHSIKGYLKKSKKKTHIEKESISLRSLLIIIFLFKVSINSQTKFLSSPSQSLVPEKVTISHKNLIAYSSSITILGWTWRAMKCSLFHCQKPTQNAKWNNNNKISTTFALFFTV